AGDRLAERIRDLRRGPLEAHLPARAAVLARFDALADLDAPVELADDVLHFGRDALKQPTALSVVGHRPSRDLAVARGKRRHELPCAVLFHEPQVADTRSRIEQVLAPAVTLTLYRAPADDEADNHHMIAAKSSLGAERDERLDGRPRRGSQRDERPLAEI